MSRSYCIKPGYIENLGAHQPSYADEEHLHYQTAVYQRLRELIGSERPRRLLDIGCGSGLKLARDIEPLGVAITGVDRESEVAECRRRHSFGTWVADDIENPTVDLGEPFDIVVSADVIEHLDDPDTLLSYAKRWANPGAAILLSTPERDLRRGVEDMGPPANPAHVREWNQSEFARYLESHGARLVEHRIVPVGTQRYTCQMVVLRFAGPSIG